MLVYHPDSCAVVVVCVLYWQSVTVILFASLSSQACLLRSGSLPQIQECHIMWVSCDIISEEFCCGRLREKVFYSTSQSHMISDHTHFEVVSYSGFQTFRWRLFPLVPPSPTGSPRPPAPDENAVPSTPATTGSSIYNVSVVNYAWCFMTTFVPPMSSKFQGLSQECIKTDG